MIPVLLYKHSRLVLSRGFALHQDVGNPFIITDRLKSWDLDELIIVDISPHWDSEDDGDAEPRMSFLETLEMIAQNCFVPITAGGGIQTIEQVRALIHSGADRALINSAAFKNPDLITQAAQAFGAQAIVAGIDFFEQTPGNYSVKICGGKETTNVTLFDWALECQNRGAGELFIQSIDKDGKANNYDLEALQQVISAVQIPVIICGGCGSWAHMSQALEKGAKAAAAANIYNFVELSYRQSKDIVLSDGLKIRPGTLGTNYRAEKSKDASVSQFHVENEEIWQELAKTGFME